MARRKPPLRANVSRPSTKKKRSTRSAKPKAAKKKPKMTEAQKQAWIERYEDVQTGIKCVKTSLMSITKDESTIVKINEIVQKLNKIVIHTYQFFKLFCIKYSQVNNCLPTIDKQFIVLMMKTISEPEHPEYGHYKGESLKMLKMFNKFYDDEYADLMANPGKIKWLNFGNFLENEAEKILTAIKVHLQEHFYQMIFKYIKILTTIDEHLLQTNIMIM